MIARIENGKIIVYSEFPEVLTDGVLGTTIGGYDKLSDDIHFLDGFREVVIPDYNTTLQYLSEIYFDNNNDIFTYDVINRNFNLEKEKVKKIEELKEKAKIKFSETDWYYIRNFRIGKGVPVEIEEMNFKIYNEINRMEEEIMSLENIEDIVNYQIFLDDTK